MALTLGALMQGAPAEAHPRRSGKIKHVLLLSIDGMHAVDFYNCAQRDSGRERRESILPEPGGVEPDGNQLRQRHLVEAFGLLSRTGGAGYRRLAEDDRPLLRRGV